MEIDNVKLWRVFEFRCGLLDFLKQPIKFRIRVRLKGYYHRGSLYEIQQKWQS